MISVLFKVVIVLESYFFVLLMMIEEMTICEILEEYSKGVEYAYLMDDL